MVQQILTVQGDLSKTVQTFFVGRHRVEAGGNMLKDYGVLVLISIALSFMTSSALDENVTLGQYSISFNMSTQDLLIKTCTEPAKSTTTEGIGFTYYQCILHLTNSTDRALMVGIAQYDANITSVRARNTSDDATKIWLEGLTWQTLTNVTTGPSLKGWVSTSWLNHKTMLTLAGTYPQKELDRIQETLSVKEKGKEIYKIGSK